MGAMVKRSAAMPTENMRSAFILIEPPSTVGQVERSDTCRFVRRTDERQVSFLDLPYGLDRPRRPFGRNSASRFRQNASSSWRVMSLMSSWT